VTAPAVPTWEQLAARPARAPSCPHAHDGRFSADGAAADPVTWHTLGRYGAALRGPRPPDLDLWADTGALVAWTRNNLEDYWRPLVTAGTRPARPGGLFALTPYAVVWVVTGIGRMHYTITSGDICSKEAACRHLLAVLPEQRHRVVREALRLRRAGLAVPQALPAVTAAWRDLLRGGSLYRGPFARRRELLAFAEELLDVCR
jgi:hypothetical protein